MNFAILFGYFIAIAIASAVIGFIIGRRIRDDDARVIRWNAHSEGMRQATDDAAHGRPIVPQPYIGEWPK